MPIAKELALKILGALAVGGTVIGGGIVLGNHMSKGKENTGTTGDDKEKKESTVKAPKVLEELGLSCGEDGFCSLVTGKSLSVKHEDNKSGTLTALPAAAKGVGKIKIHKAGDEAKSTFSIEVGDMTPTWKDGSTITKLEEFETYEIEEEGREDGGKKYHFKRRTKALEGKAKALGLAGSGCSLPTGEANSTTSTCDLDLTKLKAINFEGKTQGSEPTMTGEEKLSLKITKLNDSDHSKYPMGYKFELSGKKDVKIPATPRKIIKKANVSVEFKIKVTSTDNGPKTLSLEKVSKVENMIDKFKLTDCKEEGDTRTCKLPRTGLNVYKDTSNSIKGASISDHGDKTVTFEEDVAGYEGGVKLTVSSEISVSSGTPKGTFGQIPSGNYEIKEQTVEDAKA